MEFQNIFKKMAERQKNKQKGYMNIYISVINSMELYTQDQILVLLCKM